MLDKLPRPAIFAHRGASKYAPENTIAAFELAVQQNADAIELDVKLTADNRLVVIHDQTVERTTDGSGAVRRLSLAELRVLDAGSHFNSRFQSEKIPTLEEVFEIFGRRIFINVELTNYASPTDHLPQRVVELVKNFGLQESVLFSSFNPLNLIRTNRYLPEVPNALLIGSGYLAVLWHRWIRHSIPHKALHPDYRLVTIELIQRAHNMGQRVHVFTVNNAQDMKSLIANGIDGVFTDDPILAKKIVRPKSEIDE